MMYPLEEPHGWFLMSARHEHTAIVYKGDFHEPLTKGGAWVVSFQKYPSGGRLTSARGNTLKQAWQHAVNAVKVVDAGT